MYRRLQNQPSVTKDGIKVSVLCPQAVRTAMTAGNPDGVASVNGMIEPEEVAEACLRAIEAGEELTIDYNFSDLKEMTPCSCGAATCRGSRVS